MVLYGSRGYIRILPQLRKGNVFMRTFVFILSWLLAGTLFVNNSLADWPQFRGPSGNGYIGKLNHPTQWSMEENLAWSQPIPGGGWSSPIIIGKHAVSYTHLTLPTKA